MTHSLTKLIAPWLVIAGLAGAAAAQPAGSGAAPPAAPADATGARAQCTAAMNADPKFAADIVKIVDENAAIKRDQDTLNAHNDAYAHVQKNERHVIYAYAVMWIIAAAFVIFLWRRQQALQAEIAQLHRDLDAAASDKPVGGRS
ncbi:MAG TPA: hypothetical protein VF516_40260 [Kofleriaceae bacterium]